MVTMKRRLRPRTRRRSERQRLLRTFWSDARWWVIGFLFGLVLVLGFFGFRHYQLATGGPSGFWDVFYRDLQLYVFESGAVQDASAITLPLQVARILGPIVILLFAQQALGPLLRDQLQAVRAHRFRQHVLVAGLGSRGLEVARSARERGHRVVAVERVEDDPRVRVCRAAGVPVLIGDATEASVLQKAGLRRAGSLVVMCGEDATNVKVAAAASRVMSRRDQVVDCLVHIYDPRLCALLQARTPVDDVPLRLEFFNTFERGARALMLTHPPTAAHRSSDLDGDPHVLVLGLGRMGASLVAQAARSWQLSRRDPARRLQVTVVDENAAFAVDSLTGRHPRIHELCDLRAVTLDVRSGPFAEGAFVDPTASPISAAYVCFDDDVLSLETGLLLHRLFSGQPVPIVIRALTRAGLPTILEEGTAADYEDLHAFSLIERVCDPDQLFGGDEEIIARALHDLYCYERRRDGWRYGPQHDDRAHTHPALAPWEELDGEYRASNRDQAAHIGVKLAALGCRLERSDDWELPIPFTDDEVERLSELEHERWNRSRAQRGWTLGPRDLDRKQTPYLVPWSDLEDDIREHDREYVRELPTILARLGYRIVRPSPASAAID
jgi:hypothetical protein